MSRRGRSPPTAAHERRRPRKQRKARAGRGEQRGGAHEGGSVRGLVSQSIARQSRRLTLSLREDPRRNMLDGGRGVIVSSEGGHIRSK